MIIDKTVLESAFRHLIEQARAGMEGVGLLAELTARPARYAYMSGRRFGTGGILTNVAVTHWSPLTNVAEFPKYRYEVDPIELVDAYQRLEDAGYAPVAMVHSHLAGGAAPSDNDVRYATNPALLHMVVDLGPQRPHAVMWRIDPAARVEDQERVLFQVADLRFHENPPTDLTRGVT